MKVILILIVSFFGLFGFVCLLCKLMNEPILVKQTECIEKDR